MSIRVRFAPSPTGVPHIGNTRTALYNYLFTKSHQGKFIVRVEDTDQQRLVPGSLDKILEILDFVGIKWDEGPKLKGKYGPYIQSKRLKLYHQYASTLIEKNQAYYCFCSQERLTKLRKNQQKQGKQPRYDRLCAKLSPADINENLKSKKPYVVRLKVPSAGSISWTDLIQGKISFKLANIDDQILLKSDGFPTYHLGVVVDDYLMKISHVLRGAEWISSTPKQLLLYKALGWKTPHFGHFSIILGSDKAKLSKRHGAKSALDYRDEGYLAKALVTFMAYLGWSYQDNSQLLSIKQLTNKFDLNHVHQQNPIFDLEKLNFFNGKAIRAATNKDLLKLLKPFTPKDCPDDLAKKILPLIKDRLVTLKDFQPLSSFFYRFPKIDSKLLIKQSKQTSTQVNDILQKLISSYSSAPQTLWKEAHLEKIGRKLVDETKWKPRELFMTLRVAVTGATATPPLFDTLQVLGKKETILRLKHAQKAI